MLFWLKRLLIATIAALVLAGGVIGALVGPYVADDVVLDRVVRAVALDWRDFGRERAVDRLQFELDHQGIGGQVSDDDCTLTEEGEVRQVQCRWRAEVPVPGADVAIPLTFHSRAEIDGRGDLR